MSRKNRVPLGDRVARAAEGALAARHFVSAIDILVGIGWLDPGEVERWRRGQIECLEAAVRTNLPSISEAMRLFQSWATAKGLFASETAYVARTPRRQMLRFSRSGNPAIEVTYRTHWVSPQLSEKKRERLADKASRAPELVVVQPLNTEWTCQRCGGTGDLLIMESPGPACLRCAGLDDLEFLPAGDAQLTRRVKANSTRYAVVVRFSSTRRRYERPGLHRCALSNAALALARLAESAVWPAARRPREVSLDHLRGRVALPLIDQYHRKSWSLAATFEGEFSDVTRSYAGKGVARYRWRERRGPGCRAWWLRQRAWLSWSMSVF